MGRLDREGRKRLWRGQQRNHDNARTSGAAREIPNALCGDNQRTKVEQQKQTKYRIHTL